MEEKMPWFNARISMGPIIPKDVYKGLPGKLVGVTGAQHRTETLFIFRDTWTEDLSFRKLDTNIWHLSLSWAKSQGIGRRLEQITVKSVPIYLFKSKGKWSSFKITSVFSQCCFWGLIIYRESLPGIGEWAVSWKTKSRSDGRVIVDSDNSKLKHEQQAQWHCYMPNPTHSKGGCVQVWITPKFIPISWRPLSPYKLLALPQWPPCDCAVYLRYNLYTCKLVA